MNPSPEIWGNHFWFSMHTASFFYPEYPTPTDMHKYKQFYESFAYVIPCPDCKNHFYQLMNDYPIDSYLESRDSLSRWVVLVHNKVNERLGKKQMSYQQVIDEYNKKFIPAEKKDKKIKHCAILLLVIIVAFVFSWTSNMHKATYRKY